METGSYSTAIDNMAQHNKGSTYRQFLQDIVNRLPQSTQAKEASAILAVTGDDGVVNPSFVSDPYKYTKSDSGQVIGGYGPEGVQKVNSVYLNAYNTANTPPAGSGSGSGGTGLTADEAQAASLRKDITSRGGDVEAIYNSLFGGLDNLVTSRDKQLEDQYGGQLKTASDQYASAIPQIETSYAGIGASDSTDNADAKTKAKTGFEDTTNTIGKNKLDDKAKLGQYKNEQSAKIAADKEAATRNISRVGETTNVDALRTMRNDLETNLSNANVTKATLGTDGAARDTVSALTGDNGRYDSAITALDKIIKGSMSGSVKDAAVKAVTDNAGLSDAEKKKVQQTYGNVYSEQAAL